MQSSPLPPAHFSLLHLFFCSAVIIFRFFFFFCTVPQDELPLSFFNDNDVCGVLLRISVSSLKSGVDHTTDTLKTVKC